MTVTSIFLLLGCCIIAAIIIVESNALHCLILEVFLLSRELVEEFLRINRALKIVRNDVLVGTATLLKLDLVFPCYGTFEIICFRRGIVRVESMHPWIFLQSVP